MKTTIASFWQRNKIWRYATGSTVFIVAVKTALHILNWEVIGSSTLYATIISGGFFVLGFILSAIVADYKEADKIPSDFSAIVENMYEDALSIHANYPDFDLAGFHGQLRKILQSLKDDLITVHRGTRRAVHDLSGYFAQMESSSVPPNFIAKLKVEQGQLIRMLFRAYHIQTIQFMPSALILARSIVMLIVGLLLLTNIEPPSASIWLTGAISFILIYIIRLIAIISVPFQKGDTTQDDVSLHPIDNAIEHISGGKSHL